MYTCTRTGPASRRTHRRSACCANFGFTILCDIDVTARLTPGAGVTVMTRRHVDGISFADQPTALAQFFDVSTVEDFAARSSAGGD